MIALELGVIAFLLVVSAHMIRMSRRFAHITRETKIMYMMDGIRVGVSAQMQSQNFPDGVPVRLVVEGDVHVNILIKNGQVIERPDQLTANRKDS